MKKYTLVLKDGCTVEVKAKCLKDALEWLILLTICHAADTSGIISRSTYNSAVIFPSLSKTKASRMPSAW